MQRQLINIDNQELEYWPEKKTLLINIGSPFNSASRQYNWNVKSKGIGISQKIVKEASKRDLTIGVKMNGEYFFIEAWIIENFCEKTKSIYKKKMLYGELSIYVYPIANFMKHEVIKQQTINYYA